MQKILTNKGFTLVELLIVIAVIGILAASAVALLNPLEQIKKANDTKRKSDLNQIQRALDTYYNDYGRYPAVGLVFAPIRMYEIKQSNGVVTWGTTWQSTNGTTYMNILPQDPSFPSRTYAYFSTDGQSYYLYASLERGASDPQACNGGNTCPNAGGLNWGCGPDSTTAKCNYGVTSPNTSP